LGSYLAQRSGLNIADAAFTLAVGRGHFPWRRSLVCGNAAEAAALLGEPQSLPAHHLKDEIPPATVFLFSGQGSQYLHMAAGLYGTVAYFRELLDRCAELLQTHLGCDLRERLFPADGVPAAEASRALAETDMTQPALFVIEYCLARLWQHWGIAPEAMIGHSIGEYVAACLAGVFSL